MLVAAYVIMIALSVLRGFDALLGLLVVVGSGGEGFWGWIGSLIFLSVVVFVAVAIGTVV